MGYSVYMLKNVFLLSAVLVVIFGVFFVWLFFGRSGAILMKQDFLQYGLQTNTRQASIDIDLVLSGGPGKDGIPALTKPAFVSIAESNENDSFRGILVTMGGEQRFYPYSILVWHEIVNDSIGDQHFSVTFCPLCGTGIVYNREFDDTVLEFKVSGLLYESNLLMYDTATESLWSQSLGKAVVGDRLGDMLRILPFQLLSFGELKKKYPRARVLSRDTGFSRNYSVYPYGEYEENNDLFFPVQFQDTRFPLKEQMYVIPFDGMYYAIPYDRIAEGEEFFVEENISFRVVRDGSEITVFVQDQIVPGYFELWFSFFTNHQNDGVVL